MSELEKCIVLLIDVDNVLVLKIDEVLVEVVCYGVVNVCCVYGNWKSL